MWRYAALLAVVLILVVTKRAAAIDCSPFWTLGTPNGLRHQDVARRLGPELWGKLLKRADQDQWSMILAHSDIVIEATPTRMVLLKNLDPEQDNRGVVEYRNVTWLRDLRRGASRPDKVLLGITYYGEAGSGGGIEKDREVALPGGSDSIPFDPKRRYIIGLPLTPDAKLRAFANSLTGLPIADIGDPTSGCTTLFSMDTAPPLDDHSYESSTWGSLRHWEMGMEMIARFRDRPELY